MFDTEKPNAMEFHVIQSNNLIPLHQATPSTDFDFLKQHFPSQGNVEHPIFSNFNNSYYYCAENM